MTAEPTLILRNLTKTFGSVRANDGIGFHVAPGELVCLFGENGAGKSTLSGCLSGLHRPDTGEIILGGKPVSFSSAADAIRAGVALVHQHFVLVDDFTVLENIIMGHERGPFIDYRRAEKRLATLCDAHGITVRPNVPVRDLTVGERQWVELLKALFHEARLLILDEPAATLDLAESRKLFRVVDGLRAKGTAVILISHSLDEVMRSDRVIVLRRGKVAGERRTRDTTAAELTRLMVGRDVERKTRGASVPGPARLVLENVTVQGMGGVPLLNDLSLTVRGGEILGIAGVAGNGQKPLIEVAAGVRRADAGRVLLDGRETSRMGAHAVRGLGVGHIPEDRFAEGLIGAFSISENIALGDHRDRFARGGLLDRLAMRTAAKKAVAEYSIAAPSHETKAVALSGGNAQRVILARELEAAESLLLADQPTRGLDVGATEYVHTKLLEKRAGGCAVVFVSSELEDLLNLCDRIAVMFQGRLMGIVDARASGLEEIGLLMAGATLERAA